MMITTNVQLTNSVAFTLASKPASYFADHVRSLHLGFTVLANLAIELLGRCINIQNLASWHLAVTRTQEGLQTLPSIPDVDSILAKPLQRLCVGAHMETVIGYLIVKSAALAITHLFFFYGPLPESLLEMAPAVLPNLTHFACVKDRFSQLDIQQFLHQFPRIVSVVVVVPRSRNASKPIATDSSLDDPRVSYLQLQTILTKLEKPWRVWEIAEESM